MSNVRNVSFAIVTALCALSSSLVSSEAGASASDPGIPTATVRYSDLDLTTTDGLHVLYQRLRVASRQVCRAYEGPELTQFSHWQACYNQALNGAVTQLKLPGLTSLHVKSSPHSTLG